ncbi:MAG TPA: hypothetical protein VIY48_01515 [Candidatus Paceibacterota bacterium]
MAYSQYRYQLTDLLQDAWYRMGQLKTWKITGGSTTTLINTLWAGIEDVIYEDDDPALIYGTAVVVGHAGSPYNPPRGQFGMITDYDSASQTATIEALTVALAADDEIGIASPQFPYRDMMHLANIGLRKLGEIDVVDTSIAISANQTEYSLPTAIQKRPKRVRKQTLQTANDNEWKMVQGWDVIPATAGSPWILTIPQLTQGYSLEVLYEGFHPELTGFDSPIQDAIAPELAICALVSEAYQWYNNQIGGTNQYFLQRENKAIQDLEAAKVQYPIKRFVEQVQGMPHWGARADYVPLTSDLRE